MAAECVGTAVVIAEARRAAIGTVDPIMTGLSPGAGWVHDIAGELARLGALLGDHIAVHPRDAIIFDVGDAPRCAVMAAANFACPTGVVGVAPFLLLMVATLALCRLRHDQRAAQHARQQSTEELAAVRAAQSLADVIESVCLHRNLQSVAKA